MEDTEKITRAQHSSGDGFKRKKEDFSSVEANGFVTLSSYDYNPKTKGFVIDGKGAETARLVYETYLEGAGRHQIMKEVGATCMENRRWFQSMAMTTAGKVSTRLNHGIGLS
jgi:hypothetical protein